MPFAMVVTDPHLPDNPIIYVNKAFERITQYTADFAIGRNCRFLQGADTDPETVQRLREGIERRKDVSVTLTNYRADGEAFTNRLLVAPLFDGNGEVAMYLGIQREMVEGERSNDDEAARAAAQAVRDFSRESRDGGGKDPRGREGAPFSEIRSRVSEHMSMLLGLVSLSDADVLSDVAPRKLGRRIESLQLLYEELDRAGVSSVHEELVPAGAYLSRVAATLTHLEGRRSIRVNVDCDEAILPSATAARLGLLLSELQLNALRHAFPERSDGLVNIEFKVLTGDRARLIVKDDGIGLKGEFDWPYTRDEDAEDAEEERSGHRVGAKLVREIVGSLNAQIDVRSDDFGTTAEIGLVLPEMREDPDGES